MLLKIIYNFFILLFFDGCGNFQKKIVFKVNQEEFLKEAKSIDLNLKKSKYDFISVEGFVNDESNTFALDLVGSISAYKISVESCASGLSANLTEVSSSINLYIYDQNCLAKLTEFTVGGHVFRPSGGGSVPFTDWQGGNTAIFVSATNLVSKYQAKIISTLSHPLLAGDVIQYKLSRIAIGSDGTILGAIKNAAAELPSATGSMSFSLKTIELAGTAANDSAQFSFVFECVSDLVLDICDDVDLGKIDYKLVYDSYASSPITSDAEDIFTTSGTAVSLPADRISVGSLSAAHGGFRTQALNTPEHLLDNAAMILMIRVDKTPDPYQYFYYNVDVIVEN